MIVSYSTIFWIILAKVGPPRSVNSEISRVGMVGSINTCAKVEREPASTNTVLALSSFSTDIIRGSIPLKYELIIDKYRLCFVEGGFFIAMPTRF